MNLVRRLGRLLPTPTVPILMYHHLRPDEGGVTGDDTAISLGTFRRQMQWLAEQGIRTLLLDEVASGLRTGPWKGRAAITFDDGFADTFELAFPVLQEFGLKATVFLVSGKMGKTTDWEQGGPTPLMSWAQAGEMARTGHGLQAHTHSHADLTRCDDARVLEELTRCREQIEQALSQPVRHLAYPFGRYDARVQALAAKASYASACAADMAQRARDPYALERFDMQRFQRPGAVLGAGPWANWLRGNGLALY